MSENTIDHFHKWRPLLHSFVFMLIRPTALVLKQIFLWNLLAVTRLVGLISIKTKEYFIWPPLWKKSICLLRLHEIPNYHFCHFSKPSHFSNITYCVQTIFLFLQERMRNFKCTSYRTETHLSHIKVSGWKKSLTCGLGADISLPHGLETGTALLVFCLCMRSFLRT